MNIFRILLSLFAFSIILSVGALSVSADEVALPTIQKADSEYELRVHFGGIFEKESQIVTRVKIGKLFFAKSERPIVYTPEQIYNAPDADRPEVALYVASGILSAPKDGKFPFEFTFIVQKGSQSTYIYGPNRANVEIGEPLRHYSGAVVKGYTATLAEIETPLQDKEK